MKKSRLKEIIKEQLKLVIKEQSSNPNARRITTLYCDGSHANANYTGNSGECSAQHPNVPHFANAPQGTTCYGSMNASFFTNMTISGQAPQLGDVFNFNDQLNGITNFPGGINAITNSSNPTFWDGWFGNHVVVSVDPATPTGMVTDYPSAAACPPFPGGNTTGLSCPGCDGGQHTWNNATNWQNNFTTNMQNASWFNAPNQPCQFLNNRITHWEGIQAGLNSCNAYHNQLTCKIKYVDAILRPQYNC